MMENSSLPTIRFRLDDKGIKLFADIIPIGDHPLPEATDIEKQLATDKLSELHFNNGAIAGILKLARETSKPVSIEIGERRDAEYLLEVSEDGMQAWLTLTPAKGGKAANQADLEKALEEAGVTNGKNPDALSKALQDGQSNKLLIATGRLPVTGEDSRFETLYEESIDRKPEIDEKGRANYHALGNIASVEPGDPVMRRHPPTEGKAGLTVLGEKIAAQPGENIMYAAGLQGVRTDDKDPNMLYATIAGHPVAIENGVNVDNLYIIDNVDLTTGNIDFDGSIKVNHDVRQGVSIKAEGDIFIGGTVEAATLQARGDIEISGGVIGLMESQEDDSEKKWSTRITAGKSLRIQFAENAWLKASKKIIVAEVVTRCSLTADDSIVVGTEGCKKGYVLGGELRANQKIQCVVAGSQASIPTHLFAAYTIQDIQLKIDTLKKEITLKDELLEKLGELIRRLESGQMQDTGNLLVQATSNKNEVKAAIAERKNAIRKYHKQLAELSKAVIEIGQRAYTNVHGYIGTEVHRISDETVGGQFKLKNHKVIFSHE